MNHCARLFLRSGSFLLGAAFFCAFSLSVSADPLQGRIEDNVKTGKQSGSALQDELEAKLDQVEAMKGSAQGFGLNGGVQGNGGMSPLQGGAQADKRGPMNLSASNDPDGADQSLQIGWDRWRNTLTQSIQAGTNNKLNVHNDANFVFDQRKQMMVSRFPQGISAWYSCDVLPNGAIINVRISQASGNQLFDQYVYQSILDLQGSPILRYPAGSNRQIVNQQGSVQTASETRFQNFQFGDVERQRR